MRSSQPCSSLTLLIASAAAVPGFGPLAPVAAVLNEEAGRYRTQTSRARRLVLHLPRGHTEPILVEFDSAEEMYPGIPAAHAQRRWLLVEPVGRPAVSPWIFSKTYGLVCRDGSG